MSGGNWIEIAYGTSSGYVRVIVQHPETVGQCPQLFQTFAVHRAKVTRVVLSEKHLISEMQHVRTWSVTRFRGMISTQPGSTPIASFHVISMDPPPSIDTSTAVASGVVQSSIDTSSRGCRDNTTSTGTPANLDGPSTDCGLYQQGNDPGPFGERDEQLLFIQKVLPDADQVFVRLAANGKRVCVIRSVDGSPISGFCVHECDGSSRVVAHPRRYLFTGHLDGSVQIWDLTTALEAMSSDSTVGVDNHCSGGPTPRELIRLLDTCDLTASSRINTPTNLSPSPSTYWNGRPHAPGTNQSQWSLASTNQNSSAWNLNNQNRD